MQKLVIFLLLLSFIQQNVDGCNKKCKPKRFKCPTGTWRHGEYDMPTFEHSGNCFVERGWSAKEKIASNCWPENINLARHCLETKSDSCSGPIQDVTQAVFDAACHSHDMCYHTYFGENTSKKDAQHHCDNIFYDNLRASCDSGSWYYLGTSYVGCQTIAYSAYVAVWNWGEHWGLDGWCWLKSGRKRRSENNITFEANVDISVADLRTEKQMPISNKRQNFDEFEQSYKDFQGSCWALFGHNTTKIWNEIQPLINKCKAKNNKRKLVSCLRKIRKNLNKELENMKASLIDCIEIESDSSNRINILDSVAINENMTREDIITLKRSDLWNKANKNRANLFGLEDGAIDTIENTWKQNEGKWKKCWKTALKIARKKGYEMAEKKIKSCWKMDIDTDVQEELSISA